MAKSTRKAKKTADRRAVKAAKKAAKKSVAKKAARKAAARKTSAAKRAPRKAARKAAKKATRSATKQVARKTAKKAAPRSAMKRTAKKAAAKKATRKPSQTRRPAPIREAIPSSLNLSERSSAARSGRANVTEKLKSHHETGPALTGGDLDANWDVAYSSGDEAPGGDNPTPDQDVVDEIGRALGVEYESNEELKGAAKLEERDKHRWELDPASAEDYPDHEQ